MKRYTESRRRGMSYIRTKKRKKATGLATPCVGTIFENILLSKIIGKVTERRGRRRKQPLDDLKEMRG
jgi:hypothetical protein